MTKDDLIDHFRAEPDYWFVPKLFGIGATPVTWQGWALTLGFAALLILDIRFMPDPIARVVVGVALTAAFLTICFRKTQGGWRWHWGFGK
ncbi:hypothetical protein [Sphingomonas sp. HMP6]|uniref:hypothetical protein n=1 Tax=Sphingomonas sp. HMP6 TaxID=1517551 RepID=UPI001596496F|nr:hypothetical protein [Sphingomonas sp. HMP6]BCA59643.1 hypothetical protein HMP06_2412 [Sphingomonas sp. HMP6]